MELVVSISGLLGFCERVVEERLYHSVLRICIVISPASIYIRWHAGEKSLHDRTSIITGQRTQVLLVSQCTPGHQIGLTKPSGNSPMISVGGPPSSCISPTNLPISFPSLSSEYPGFLNVSTIFCTRLYCVRYFSRSAAGRSLGGEARYSGYCPSASSHNVLVEAHLGS